MIYILVLAPLWGVVWEVVGRWEALRAISVPCLSNQVNSQDVSVQAAGEGTWVGRGPRRIVKHTVLYKLKNACFYPEQTCLSWAKPEKKTRTGRKDGPLETARDFLVSLTVSQSDTKHICLWRRHKVRTRNFLIDKRCLSAECGNAAHTCNLMKSNADSERWENSSRH